MCENQFQLGICLLRCGGCRPIADQAARTLARDRTAAMCCTAAIAAEVPEIIEKATFASKMVVIDGCDKACARKIMDKAGFSEYAYVELGAQGMEKGKTSVDEENISRAAAVAAEALTSQTAV